MHALGLYFLIPFLMQRRMPVGCLYLGYAHRTLTCVNNAEICNVPGRLLTDAANSELKSHGSLLVVIF